MALQLVVPGLFDGVAGTAPPGETPSLPNLERLLARSGRRAGPAGYAETLFELFGVARPPAADLPTAAVCYLADSGQRPDGYLLHADPVHLVPDQDRVLLFAVPPESITAATSHAYVQAFNAHFAADGLELVAPQAARWYLKPATPPQLRTTPLPQVAGRNIDPYLPRGPDAAPWRQLLNEVQMLFHPLAAEADRPLPINGLWFSGGGVLPDAPARALQLRGDRDPLLRGLGVLASPAVGSEPLDCQVNLKLLASCLAGDAAGRDQALLALERALPQLLQQGQGRLALYPCNGTVFHWRRLDRWRLWRRRRPFGDYLTAARPPGTSR
jgi:hypothetical protein